MRCAFAAVLLGLMMAGLAAAEGYLGMELRELDGKVVAGAVRKFSPAAVAGISYGDTVLSVSGKTIKSAKQIEEIVAATEPGKLLRFEITTLTGRRAVKVRVGDAVEGRKQEEAERAQEAEAAAARAKAASTLRRRIIDAGPLIVVGKVRDDVIGSPEILLLVQNIGEFPIEAVAFEVALFDKFGNAVTGLWGNTNRKTFLFQNVIDAGAEQIIVLGIPWHATTGRAEVSATRYVMRGDRIFTPKNPPVVEVRR